MKPETTSWFVYIVECADGTLYTGITKNIEKRIKEHNSKKGAKYTKSRTPVKLVDFVKVPNRSFASKVEAKIKRRAKKDKIGALKEEKKRYDILEKFSNFKKGSMVEFNPLDIRHKTTYVALGMISIDRVIGSANFDAFCLETKKIEFASFHIGEVLYGVARFMC